MVFRYPDVIGICGPKDAGKSTIQKYLQTIHGYTSMSMAKSLKDGVACFFGWDRAMLEGDTAESREWREKPDAFWDERIGADLEARFSGVFARPVTPRKILQLWGTDVTRKGVCINFWCHSIERALITAIQSGEKVVISDTRFPNEMNMVRRLGGEIWCVEGRGDTADGHESEAAWKSEPKDVTIDNSGTLEDLYTNVDDALAAERSSTHA